MKKIFLFSLLCITYNTGMFGQTVLFDDCESLTGWSGGGNVLTLSDVDPRQGVYSVQTSGGNTERFRRLLDTPLNTQIEPGELAVAYLQFSLYIDDVSRFSGEGQFEITSSGSPDVNEYNWNTNGIPLVSGWNDVVLRLSGAGTSGGAPDLSAINFFRFYRPVAGGQTVVTKIDNIRFTKGYEGSILIGAHIFSAADHTTGWSADDPLSVDETNRILGTGSLTRTGSGSNWFTYLPDVPYNTSVSEEGGFVKFWLYVSGTAGFNGSGTITFSSSEDGTTDRYVWDLGGQPIENGWNHLILKLSEADKNGSPDPGSIRYFSIDQPLSSSITAKIDEIEFYEPEDVDTSTLEGKVMFGYQGWFGTPNDGNNANWWVHWFNGQPAHANATFDMWPYMKDVPADELDPTNMTYRDGSPAGLFSSFRFETVDRHFRWMAEHEMDGVFQQRFLDYVISGDQRLRNHHFKIIDNVQRASKKHKRVWVMMYDLAGATSSGAFVQAIIDDWKTLVDEYGVAGEDDTYYLKHKGKPLLTLWGLGNLSGGTPEQNEALVRWFKEGDPDNPESEDNDPKYRVTLMGGLNDSWRTHSQEWLDVYDLLDVISPWSVGRYSSENGANSFLIQRVIPDMEYCDNLGIDYMPVIFPGFSWFNLQTSGTKNQIPRMGGSFVWQQARNVLNAGAKMVYLAMFDEVDEGTSWFKMEKYGENVPTGPASDTWFLALDADGFDLTPDWYLALAGYTKKVLQGKATNSLSVPLFPNPVTTSPLPVTLTRFTIALESADAHLHWETTEEVNSSHFEVERSRDARNFTAIGSVEAHRNTSGVRRYLYNDPSLPSGTYYYRLKMVDTDGTFSYSRLASIRIDRDAEIVIYPNPAEEQLTITAREKISRIDLVDLRGQTVHSASPDASTYTFPLSGYAGGLYLLRVNDRVYRVVKKP